MSRHIETFVVNGRFEQVRALCDVATSDLTRAEPWTPAGGIAIRTVVKQGWNLLSIKNPVTLDITLTQSGRQVQVSLQASSLGWGPIQDNNVKAMVERVRTALTAAQLVATPAETARGTTPPLASQASLTGVDSPRPAPVAPAVRPAPCIFVSYRREDSADVTGRLCDALGSEFGVANIFRDVDSIPLGADFREHLGTAVQRCRVLLAIIGKNWAGVQSDGSRRLDDQADFVRVEVESAIARGVPVIPLLVGQATMPKADTLPTTLEPLAYKNGMSLRPDPDFHNDVARLCRDLRSYLAGDA